MPGFAAEDAPFGPDLPTYTRAMHSLASLHQNDDPMPWLQRGLAASRNTDQRADFLLRMGQVNYLRRPDEARRYFEQLRRTVSRTDYRYRAAGSYIVGINHAQQQAATSQEAESTSHRSP